MTTGVEAQYAAQEAALAAQMQADVDPAVMMQATSANAGPGGNDASIDAADHAEDDGLRAASITAGRSRSRLRRTKCRGSSRGIQSAGSWALAARWAYGQRPSR